MFLTTAKYHFLFFATVLIFSSCQFNQAFKHQKYTQLHLSETYADPILTNDSTKSNYLTYQSAYCNLLLENNATISPLEKEIDDTLVNQKDQIVPEIKNAIVSNTPIVVVCQGVNYLVKEPSYDSLTNFLCGNYTTEYKLNIGSNPYLEIDYSEHHCSDINENCIHVKKIQGFKKPMTLACYGITMVNPEQTLEECVDNGISIYLITSKGNYIVHEPKLDTSLNILKGRFVQIGNEQIIPNLCVVLYRSGSEQIDSGYVNLSSIKSFEDSSTDYAGKKSGKEIKKENRNLALASVLFLLSLLYLIIGLTIGSGGSSAWGVDKLQQAVKTMAFVAVGVTLVLAIICLSLVLK